MVRSPRAYFILYVIKIRWIMCPEKTELSSMSERSGVRDQGGVQSKFQDISPLLQKKQRNRLQKHFLKGGKRLAPSYPGVAFATPCHPMAKGLGSSFNKTKIAR